jgi:hypothetical protein
MKTINVIKQSVVDGKLSVAEDVTVNAKSIAAALAGIKARAPKFLARHSGISFFRDADGWLYLVSINP